MGSDAIYGLGGNDTMQGGSGDDAYFVDQAGDVVQENPGAGSDTIFAQVNFTLPANVDILAPYGAATAGTGNDDANVLLGTSAAQGLTLDGRGGNDVVFGSNFADTLIGGTGGDLLRGFGGDDTMQGGVGNDVYFVDQAGDIVQEDPGAGSDTVYAQVNYTLPANVEILTPYGAATAGTGNDDANVLLGTSGAQGLTLDGRSGNDTIYGSNFADTLIGGTGNDLLWGLGGNDTMQGGIGDDIYFVEQTGDVVQENPGEGADMIYASANITLPDAVEVLSVYGAATAGTGNAGDNTIVNAYISTGVTLTGNGGNDTFVFTPGMGNNVTITDFVGNGAGAGDRLQFAGYGPGATLVQNDATHWQVNYGAGQHDILTFANAAALHPSDVFFT